MTGSILQASDLRAQGGGTDLPSSRNALRIQVPLISKRNRRSNQVGGGGRVRRGESRGLEREGATEAAVSSRGGTWSRRMVLLPPGPGVSEHPGCPPPSYGPSQVLGDPTVSIRVKDGAPALPSVTCWNTKPQCLLAASTAPSLHPALPSGAAPRLALVSIKDKQMRRRTGG